MDGLFGQGNVGEDLGGAAKGKQAAERRVALVFYGLEKRFGFAFARDEYPSFFGGGKDAVAKCNAVRGRFAGSYVETGFCAAEVGFHVFREKRGDVAVFAHSQKRQVKDRSCHGLGAFIFQSLAELAEGGQQHFQTSFGHDFGKNASNEGKLLPFGDAEGLEELSLGEAKVAGLVI